MVTSRSPELIYSSEIRFHGKLLVPQYWGCKAKNIVYGSKLKMHSIISALRDDRCRTENKLR